MSGPAQNVAKIAPEVNMVTKTSAKVNADMKKAKKPVRKANKKVNTPKQETRRLEDVKREFIVR